MKALLPKIFQNHIYPDQGDEDKENGDVNVVAKKNNLWFVICILKEEIKLRQNERLKILDGYIIFLHFLMAHSAMAFKFTPLTLIYTKNRKKR